jgi:uncharacterized protein YbjT (DUF2867 family)
MFAITGITGQVGGAVARELLAAGKPVRAVVRSAAKGEVWAKRGCEVALAEIGDASALQAAFDGAEGVFVLLPSSFDPAPGFPEVRSIVSAVRSALAAVRPDRIVALSTIGVQAKEQNLLSQLGIMEHELGELPAKVAFLRPAWFMENAAWDITPARERGVVPSFLQPLDKPFPMVATADVGAVAAELLQETWSGRRIVELEGPRRVTPNEIAAALTELMGRPVCAEAVPHSTWEKLFTSQDMKHPTARMRMLDGFNDGWIEFEAGPKGSRKGRIDIVAVLRDLVALSS